MLYYRCIDILRPTLDRFTPDIRIPNSKIFDSQLKVGNLIITEEPYLKIFDSGSSEIYYLSLSKANQYRRFEILIDNFDYETSSMLEDFVDLNSGILRHISDTLRWHYSDNSNKNVMFMHSDDLEGDELYYKMCGIFTKSIEDTLIIMTDTDVFIMAEKQFILTGLDEFLYGDVKEDYNLFYNKHYILEGRDKQTKYSLDLSEVDMSYLHCADKMFKNTNITRVKLNETLNGVNSVASMFNGCIYLKEIDWNGFDFRNVEYMQYMFDSAESLAHIDFNGWNTSNVVSMYCMFANSGIHEVDFSLLDLSKIDDFDRVFDRCKYLESFKYSGEPLTNLFKLKKTFRSCMLLKYVEMTGFTNVSNFTGTFNYCRVLEELDLSCINSNKYELSFTFNDCYSLKKIIGIENIILNADKMVSTFAGCKSLDLNLSINDIKVLNRMFENAVGNSVYITITDKVRKAELSAVFENSEFDTVSLDIHTDIVDIRDCFYKSRIKNVYIRFDSPKMVSTERIFYDCKIENLCVWINTRLFPFRKLFFNSDIKNLRYYEDILSTRPYDSNIVRASFISHINTNNEKLAIALRDKFGTVINKDKVYEIFKGKNSQYVADMPNNSVHKV